MEWLNLRRIAIFASAAAALSVLLAGLSGAPLLTLLFRALLSALLFGGLTALASWVFYRFIPELFEDSTDSDETPAAVGGNLNVVVGEDLSSDEQEDFNESETQADQGDISARPAVSSESGEPVEPEESEDPEELEDSDQPKTKWNVEQNDFKEGDKLPDIESFSGNFSSDRISGDGSSNAEEGSGSISEEKDLSEGPSSYMQGVNSSEDEARSYFTKNSTPEEMAKAVRTVVKRDE